MARLTLGALLYPGFELLDLYGPIEMFGMLDEIEIVTIAERPGAVASSTPAAGHAATGLDEVPALDVLLIPGGFGSRAEIENTRLIEWLARRSATAELVTTVCTGAALLAATGAIDGLRATTNKLAFDWVAGTRPQVDWQRKARWVEHGKFFTASGVSAGIDMSLAVIERLLGREKAEQVATWAEYRWHDDPHDDPFAAGAG